MIDDLKNYGNEECIVLLPLYDLEIKESLVYLFKNVIEVDYVEEDKEIIEIINNSKIKKIYLVGNNDIYRYILPRIKKEINVCWIFKNSFSALSDGGVRYLLHTIFEYIDRELVDTIGVFSDDNYIVFKNAGYSCEKIDLNVENKKIAYIDSNTIGILSNDYDPNNNFYNQLAALTFIKYDYCKFIKVMKATTHFCNYFKIKNKVCNNIDEVISNNFVNLYINFTNTNNELIRKSFNLGIPCIVGNTDFFDNNKYLKEHLVVKSDDDINEIVEKINYVKDNRKKIVEEYQKYRSED